VFVVNTVTSLWVVSSYGG